MHRLSPFNSGNTRETSFVKVEVIPFVEEDLSVEIPESVDVNGGGLLSLIQAIRRSFREQDLMFQKPRLKSSSILRGH